MLAPRIASLMAGFVLAAPVDLLSQQEMEPPRYIEVDPTIAAETGTEPGMSTRR